MCSASTHRGFPVRVLPDLGSRELVDPALMAGLVQLVVGAENLCHVAGCSADRWLLGPRRLPGCGMIFGLWA